MPAQQDHGAQVLDRHGESQLGDEVGPAGELFDAQAVGDHEGHDGDDDHRGRGDEVDGMRSHPPHRQAAEAVTRSRPSPGDGRTLGGEHEEGEGGRR